MRVPILVGLVLLAVDATGALGVTNDLQCFKLSNENLKGLKALVDLNVPSVGTAPGCKLTKAKLYCVPSEATVRPGTALDGKRPITPLGYFGSPTDRAQVCYGVKCKKREGAAPDQTVTSRFGAHQFTKLDTSMICTPLTPALNQITSPAVEIGAGQEITTLRADQSRLHTSQSSTGSPALPGRLLRSQLEVASTKGRVSDSKSAHSNASPHKG